MWRGLNGDQTEKKKSSDTEYPIVNEKHIKICNPVNQCTVLLRGKKWA